MKYPPDNDGGLLRSADKTGGRESMHKKSLLKTIRFIAAVMLVSSVVYAQESLIEVTGQAEISVVPDMAVFYFSISRTGNSIENLKDSIDEKTKDLLYLCRKLGVDEKKISASRVSIHPQYNYKTKELINYSVSQEVKVILEDLERYSELVNGAIRSGVTTLSNVVMDTSKRQMLEDRALGEAVEKAVQKAKIAARSAGVSLGKVAVIREMSGAGPVSAYRFKAPMASESGGRNTFEPGEISVSAAVSVQYYIQ